MALELTPAVLMLEDYEQFPKHETTYHVGRIGPHWVAMVVCPRIGNSPAATVVTDMRRSFPNIKHVLVVGIAGGMPHYGPDIQQIVLGDVVVSCPRVSEGGVAHYEFGAWEGKTEFSTKSHTLHPSDPLLTAVRNLESHHMRKPGPKIPVFLSEMREDLTEQEQLEFEDPGGEKDRLFLDEYPHPDRTRPCKGLCDMSKSKQRSERGDGAARREDAPRVHYGIIGSSNALVISSMKRNELYEKHEVICFEMESGGVMGNYQALVIRGICDYADSHKNKRWQKYAAATAAACAKEVLLLVPAAKLNDGPSSAKGHRGGSSVTHGTMSQPRITAGVINEAYRSTEDYISKDEMKKQVHTLSCGLAEVTPSPTLVVQFVHQSVKDFFIDKGLADIVTIDAETKDGVGRKTISQVKQLLSKISSRDCNKADWTDGEGRTPLSHSAQGGHKAVVKLLLATGKVEVNSKDKYSRTPLSYAAALGHRAVVKLLLATGKVKIDSKDECNRTPLSYAAAQGREAVIELLLATGKAEVDSKDMDKRTPLLYAAMKGHEGIVKHLLGTGKVEVNSKDSYSERTPLVYAAAAGYSGIVKLLLATGKVELDSTDSYIKRTPLLYAAAAGHEDIVKLLLATGKVEVDLKDMNERTSLSYSSEEGYEGIVKLLLGTGKVEVNSKDSNNKTPLSYAAAKGHVGIVKLLLATGNAEL
ncbi:uncharacterized protein DNG_10078 [Cephalotrichum gorgonifer]|uniref:Nucleoside phosphorylase domain-containing protein n=1 Tax=Cephalotrichum gorgonifer TaxID=2041049 RepID=A0AAE8N880_9PEZI|nr:uncharacterized protein DNG_10078 [Cephalotrichum gorgonifer]